VSKHTNVDALSRNPMGYVDEDEEFFFKYKIVRGCNRFTRWKDLVGHA
jgi:hypothetical protein